MRFASIGGSNAASYAAAGKAVADSGAKMFKKQRETGPDYAGLSKVAMQTASNEKIAGMQAEAKLTNVAQSVYADQTQNAYKIKVFETKEDIKNSRRKAGGLAAIGKIAAAGFLSASDNTKDRKYPTADRTAFDNDYKAKRDALLSGTDKQRQGIYAESDASSKALRSRSTSSAITSDATGDTPGKVTSGGDKPTTKNISLDNASNPLAGLTPKDYDDMAYTISSEAALGTDDVYGVGANLVTRLRHGGYGDTIHAISHAPGQYEGVYTGRSVSSPKISAQLQSPDGQKKLIDAFNRLDGRTEFKGQTMLHNRVASEDPMFSPNGNFFHYSGQ